MRPWALVTSLILSYAGLMFTSPAFALIPTGTVVSCPSFATYGAPTTLTATVKPSGATGKVTFYAGVLILGTSELSGGEATLSTNQLPTGYLTMRARYLGDASNAASASSPSMMTVYSLPADGFQTPAILSAGPNPGTVLVGDLNGDGKQDVVVGDAGGISVLLGNGNGTFQPPIYTAVPGLTPFGGAIVIADFNGDGIDDVAVSRNNPGHSGSLLSIFLGIGNGNFQSPVDYANHSSGPGGLFAADFNGDGIADIDAGGYVYFGKGDGTFSVSLSATALGTAVADFNGDGLPDLVMPTTETLTFDGPNVGIYQILYGNGDGTFTYSPIFPADEGEGVGTAYSGDLNGDGRPDVFLTPSQTSSPVIFLNNGDGTFSFAQFAPISFEAGFGLFADFNGDGKNDVLSLNFSSASVNLGNGDGTIQDGNTYPGFSFADIVDFIDEGTIYGAAAGDFNGDGRTDVVVALRDYNGTGAIGVILGKAYTPTATTTTLVPSENPTFSRENLELTASVSPASATGMVAFYDGSTYLGAAEIQGGRAMLTPPHFSAGTHSLTAHFDGELAAANNGSGSLAPSTSPAVNQTVIAELVPVTNLNPPPFTGNLLANPNGDQGLKDWWAMSPQSRTFNLGGGDYAFLGAVSPAAFISQTVDLLQPELGLTQSEINSGNYVAEFSFAFAYLLGGSGAYGRVTMTFYDGNLNRIAQGLSSTLDNSGTLGFKTSSGLYYIPSGARYIVYTMDFHDTAPGENEGLMRANQLTLAHI